jgi:hypothetical protein
MDCEHIPSDSAWPKMIGTDARTASRVCSR